MMFIRLRMAITLIEVIIAVLEDWDSFGTQSCFNKRWTGCQFKRDSSPVSPFESRRRLEISGPEHELMARNYVFVSLFTSRDFSSSLLLSASWIFMTRHLFQSNNEEDNIMSSYYPPITINEATFTLHKWGILWRRRQTSSQLFSFLSTVMTNITGTHSSRRPDETKHLVIKNRNRKRIKENSLCLLVRRWRRRCLMSHLIIFLTLNLLGMRGDDETATF